MKARRTLDVSELPMFAFGTRDPLWWGLMGLIAIETTMFGIVTASYFYIRQNFEVWPPTHLAPHAFRWATAGVVLLLVSAVPTHVINQSALRGSLRGMRWGLVVATLLGFAFLACRTMELASLNFRWDSNAYGSIFWLILGLHTLHGIAGTLENLVFSVLLFVGPVEKRHRVDINLNGLYWYFVIAAWLPLYAILYLETGLLHR